jgi:hypothetical protein
MLWSASCGISLVLLQCFMVPLLLRPVPNDLAVLIPLLMGWEQSAAPELRRALLLGFGGYLALRLLREALLLELVVVFTRRPELASSLKRVFWLSLRAVAHATLGIGVVALLLATGRIDERSAEFTWVASALTLVLALGIWAWIGDAAERRVSRVLIVAQQGSSIAPDSSMAPSKWFAWGLLRYLTLRLAPGLATMGLGLTLAPQLVYTHPAYFWMLCGSIEGLAAWWWWARCPDRFFTPSTSQSA